MFSLVSQDNADLVTFSIGENENNNNSNTNNNAATTNEDAAHKPHQLFCEMDELQPNLEWKEAARWLKFEEDVENGGRWSKPHVATLSLHSLFELRNCLLNGAVLLDYVGEDLPTIIGNYSCSCFAKIFQMICQLVNFYFRWHFGVLCEGQNS